MQSQAERKLDPGRRILVVDDDIDAAQTLFLLLLDMGHDAAYATDGRGALAAARKLQPEFIFLDIGLPDLDGSEVAKDLRRLPGCQNSLIIAVTGLGGEHRPRMLAAGCDAFYTKPVDPHLLAGLLKR